MNIVKLGRRHSAREAVSVRIGRNSTVLISAEPELMQLVEFHFNGEILNLTAGQADEIGHALIVAAKKARGVSAS